MTQDALTILDAPVVSHVRSSGYDESVVQAARVSVVGENGQEVEVPESILSGKDKGLIGYLMREKHGSPFEHNSITFYVQAPIFVFREFMRHRIASYNERSGRYSELEPVFYVPNSDRPLINVGKSSKPNMAFGDDPEKLLFLVEEQTAIAYEAAWSAYQMMLDANVAPEVARIVLPVGIYSEMYVTMNARALMNFLSLRVEDKNAAHVSHPQYQIQQVAKAMEQEFARLFPVTHTEFIKNKRVAP